jgi:hypothetical protein
MPLSFTTEELHMLLELAEPIAYGRRNEFLAAVAKELATLPQTDAGAT